MQRLHCFQLCLHQHNSINTIPNDSIHTLQNEAEFRLSGGIQYVYIHEGKVFLLLKILH